MNNKRRTFFITLAAGISLLATSAHSQAKADEKGPQSVALGYVADATKTDTKKYPQIRCWSSLHKLCLVPRQSQ